MTLDNKYKEIMDNVKVNDDMRDRILKNIDDMDIKRDKARISPVRKARISGIIGLVACCGIVIAAGGFLLRGMMSSTSKGSVKEEYNEAETTVAEEVDGINKISTGNIDSYDVTADDETFGFLPVAGTEVESADETGTRSISSNPFSRNVESVVLCIVRGNSYSISDRDKIEELSSLMDAYVFTPMDETVDIEDPLSMLVVSGGRERYVTLNNEYVAVDGRCFAVGLDPRANKAEITIVDDIISYMTGHGARGEVITEYCVP